MDRKEKFEYVISAIVGLFCLFLLLIMRAGMFSPAMALASIVVLVAFIIFAGLWEFGYIDITYKIFSVVYKRVEPTSTKAKIIVVFASVLYGLFALYMGGGLYGYLPFFMHPYGIVYVLFAIIVMVIGYFVLVYILEKLIK
jgi:hypothetical protein